MNHDKEKWICEAIAHNRDECLLWPYGKTSAGYGVVSVDGKQRLVHRYVCEIANGPPSPEQTDAAHNCGNGHIGCANPKHLRWATRSENMRDCRGHGTIRYGEAHLRAKLTAAQVCEIRSSPDLRKNLASRFGVSPALITLVRQRKVWVHI